MNKQVKEYVYASYGTPMCDAVGIISLPRNRVVRCKDCKHYRPQGTYHFTDGTINRDTCKVIRGYVVQIDPDGFCAWGERRE